MSRNVFFWTMNSGVDTTGFQGKFSCLKAKTRNTSRQGPTLQRMQVYLMPYYGATHHCSTATRYKSEIGKDPFDVVQAIG